MHRFFEMANERQHRQDSFHDHGRITLASLAYLQIVGIPVPLHKAFIGKNDHVAKMLIDDLLEDCAIVDISGGDVPVEYQAQVVQDKAQLSVSYPTPIRQAFASDLLLAPSFAAKVNEFNPVGVHEANQGASSQETVSP